MKEDKDGFPIYEPCDRCIFKDKKFDYCNVFDIRIIGDMEYCIKYRVNSDLD